MKNEKSFTGTKTLIELHLALEIGPKVVLARLQDGDDVRVAQQPFSPLSQETRSACSECPCYHMETLGQDRPKK